MPETIVIEPGCYCVRDKRTGEKTVACRETDKIDPKTNQTYPGVWSQVASDEIEWDKDFLDHFEILGKIQCIDIWR